MFVKKEVLIMGRYDLRKLKTKLHLDDVAKIAAITEEEIYLTNGYVISYDHMGECCEHNFADFLSIKDTPFEDFKFEQLTFEATEYGFLLNGYHINCYSYQNGYYTSEVDIYVYNPYTKEKIEVLNTWGEVKE